MSRALVAVAVSFAPIAARACPACAGSASNGPSVINLALVILPFVVGGLAARAIVRALRD